MGKWEDVEVSVNHTENPGVDKRRPVCPIDVIACLGQELEGISRETDKIIQGAIIFHRYYH